MQKALPLVPSLQSNWLMMHVSMMMISYATLILGSLLSILYLAFLFFNSSISSSFSQEEDSNQNEDAIKSNENLEKIRNRKEKEGEFSLEKNYGIVFNSDFPNFNKIEIKSAERSSPLLVRPSLSTSPSIYENSSKNSLLETVDIWSYRIIGLGFPFLTIGIISGAVWANEAWGSYWSWDPKETWAFITWLVFAIYLHSRLLKGWQGKKAAILGSCGFFVIWICYLGVNFLGKGLHSYGWVL
jgi:cytochrome c-type biogenesis protein CcsB